MSAPPPPAAATDRPALPRRGALFAALLVGAVLAALIAVLFGTGGGEDRSSLPPPPPEAPPDPGLPPPEVDPDQPQEARLLVADWAGALAEPLEIPETALRAYGYAAAVTAEQDSDCELPWTVLAGIGSVESNHGRFEGSVLGEDGRSDPPIRGLPLDGGSGRLEIRDTDGGRLDDDLVYDRAVGPMQFIPTTWKQWRADADGDGVADPDDLDDAALAAAGYLCASGDELSSAEGWWEAVLTYNRSTAYGRAVLARAGSYGTASRAT